MDDAQPLPSVVFVRTRRVLLDHLDQGIQFKVQQLRAEPIMQRLKAIQRLGPDAFCLFLETLSFRPPLRAILIASAF